MSWNVEGHGREDVTPQNARRSSGVNAARRRRRSRPRTTGTARFVDDPVASHAAVRSTARTLAVTPQVINGMRTDALMGETSEHLQGAVALQR